MRFLSVPFILPLSETLMNKLAILREIFGFLAVRKKWWLLPIVVVLLLMAGLLLITEGSALAPFIYALF